MKILFSTIFFTSFLFANYNFIGQNSGKIDMHGGKSDKLLSNKNKFSKPSINSLSDINIKKPASPFAPKALIEKEKKDTSKKTKNTSKK